MGRHVEPILALDALRPLCFVIGVDARRYMLTVFY